MNSLISLLSHWRGSLFLSAVFPGSLAADLTFIFRTLTLYLQMVKFLGEHHRLFSYREIYTWTLFCLKVIKPLFYYAILAHLSLTLHFFFLTLTVILDLQKLLSTLPLPLYPCQDTLLIPLQYVEACLKRFKHAWVFILYPCGENQGLKAARLAATSFIFTVALVGSIRAHAIVASIPFPTRITTKPFFLLIVTFVHLAVIGGLTFIRRFFIKDYFRIILLPS